MARDVSPETLVRLPILAASWAYVLITRIISAADAKIAELTTDGTPLPTAILDALEDLRAACLKLGEAIQPDSATNDSARSTADTTLDNSWRSLYNFLLAWLDQDPASNPYAQGTRALYDLLFYDGLAFLKEKYELEWQESQKRLDVYTADASYSQTLQALGGQPFMASLEKAHADYGVALGITQPGTPTVSAAVQDALMNASHVLRVYILQVAAFAETRFDNAPTIAEVLLEPYINWDSSRTQSEATTDDPDAVTTDDSDAVTMDDPDAVTTDDPDAVTTDTATD